MSKMRVLALSTSYPLRPDSTAGVFVQSVYRRLPDDCVVEVVCPADSKPLRAEFIEGATTGIRIHAVRYAPRAWRGLAQQSGGVLAGLRRAPWSALLLPGLLFGLFWRCLMCARDADVVHANWAICGAIAGIVGRWRRKPVITTLRGSDVVRAGRSRLDRAILGMAVRGSRSVVCVSEAMAGRLRALFPLRAVDIHACLNGTDEAFFRIDRVTTDAQVLRVLAVGNLIRLKGFDVLIEAVARARRHGYMHVRIVGEGPEREALLALAASRGVAGSFTFAGAVPAADMPHQMADADVFVLSSRSEGRPNVVVEALASGLPVISTDLEGVQGMVVDGDTGWLVAVDDVDALAAALDQAAIDRAELRRRSARAHALARARLGTWEDTALAYESLFRAALAQGGRRDPSCAE